MPIPMLQTVAPHLPRRRRVGRVTWPLVGSLVGLLAGLLPTAGAEEPAGTVAGTAPAAGYYYNGWTGELSHGLRERDPRLFANIWWDRRFASGWSFGTGAGIGERLRGQRDFFLMLRGRRHFGPMAVLGGFEPRIGFEAGHTFYIGPASASSLLGSIGLGTPASERTGLSVDLLWGHARSDRAGTTVDDPDDRRRSRPLLLRLGLTFRH